MKRPEPVIDTEMNYINALVDSVRDWASFFKRHFIWLISVAIVCSLIGLYLVSQQKPSYTSTMVLTPFIQNVRILNGCNKTKLNEVLLSDSILSNVLETENKNGTIREQLQAFSPELSLTDRELIHQLRSYLFLYRAHDRTASKVTLTHPDLTFSANLLGAFSAELTDRFLYNAPIDYISFTKTVRSAIHDMADSLAASRNRLHIFKNSIGPEQMTESNINRTRRLASEVRMDSTFYNLLMQRYAEEKLKELHNPVPYLNSLIKGDIHYTEKLPTHRKTFLVVMFIGMTLTILILRARDLIHKAR